MNMFGGSGARRVFLDCPKEILFSQTTQVAGWYVGTHPIAKIILNGQAIPAFELEERLDVAKKFPVSAVVTGFRFAFDTCKMPGCKKLLIEIVDEIGREARGEFELEQNAGWALKKIKLEKLREILRLDVPHVRTSTSYDFLDEETARRAGLVDAKAVSSHNYSPDMVAEIERVPEDGWVLDCGAGYRRTEYENVVLFEIEPYVSTDVRGVCEALPFKDESFDLILSVVVLEHVRNPFLAAREMKRVLKPGGRIWVDVAFMQPYHGYPNHYYNMTKDGLRNLFSDGFDVVREFVPNYGEPFWSLSWILQVYSSGLNVEDRDRFRRLTVGEIIERAKQLGEEDWVRSLSEETMSNLAATHSILVEKR